MRIAVALLASLSFAQVGLPSCPVTNPNGSAPPRESPSPAHHGNGSLWTGLWPAGKVVFTPGRSGEILADGALSMKFFWWRGVEGKLSIAGRRLDKSAPPLRAYLPAGYGDTGFQASALIFPAPGCWEVTGRVGDAPPLTFVTLVISEYPKK